MRQIYEQAPKVFVWLGKPEDEDNNRLASALIASFQKSLDDTLLKGPPFRPWWWLNRPRSVGQDLADFVLTLLPAKHKSVFDVPGSPTHEA